MAHPSPKTKEAVYDVLDEYAAGDKRSLGKDVFGGGLITSYLLEYHSHKRAGDIKPVLASDTWSLKAIDGGAVYSVTEKGHPLGYAERISPRYLLVHSPQETQEADAAVRRRVKDSVDLDFAWLSGSFLERLWREWILPSNPGRTAHLKFSHQSYFDVDVWDDEDGDEDGRPVLRRHFASESTSDLKETGERLGAILEGLQGIHKPFHAIQMVRVPSHEARGSYDLWGWGKMTHRSDNFRRGRLYLEAFADFYERVVAAVEERMWFFAEDIGPGYSVHGAPLTVKFEPALDPDVFDRLINSTFVSGHGPLRLWGKPIWVGPQRVHVYGIDLHLWQQMYMELTPEGVMVVLPRGTCGNTVNRLLANLQQFVSPGLRAWVGDQSYSELVSACLTLTPADAGGPFSPDPTV